jgi:hypothetical protein
MAYRSRRHRLEPFGPFCALMSQGRDLTNSRNKTAKTQSMGTRCVCGIEVKDVICGRCSGVKALISLVAEVTFLYRTRPLKFA